MKMAVVSKDIKELRDFSMDRVKSSWAECIMVFLLLLAPAALLASILLIVYGIFHASGAVTGNMLTAAAENHVYMLLCIGISIAVYILLAPVTVGCCWWFIHFVRDKSHDLRCILSSYRTPTAFLKALRVKIVTDIAVLLALFIFLGLFLLADTLLDLAVNAAGQPHGALVAANIAKVFVGIVLCIQFALSFLRTESVVFFYTMNPDEDVFRLMKICRKITRDNRKTSFGVLLLMLIWSPVLLLTFNALFVLPYWVTLLSCSCIALTDDYAKASAELT